MPTTKLVEVSSLELDLKNYRTIPQKDEKAAVHAMISISPERFWALMHSLLDDGYLTTDNIIVLKQNSKPPVLVVKEGNRRVAALKIIYGDLSPGDFELPADIEEKVASLPQEWKDANRSVPCAIYSDTEAQKVDRIVKLAHGKGELAGRDSWTAVARARHDRDENGTSQPALDLLEAYLEKGANLTADQKERWSGKYPLTVLDEAVKKIAPRMGFTSSRLLADAYPTVRPRKGFEEIIRDIGLEAIKFPDLRAPGSDFAEPYGIAPAPTSTATAGGSTATASGASTSPSGASAGAPGAGSTAPSGPSARGRTRAVSVEDPRAITRRLKAFHPRGAGREKLVTLLEEAQSLSSEKHKYSFCFILRSMFELSAKAYCADHKNNSGPKATDAQGNDRPLVDVLRDVVKHLTGGNMRTPLGKELHGAMTVLAKPTSIFSVTSMNQLVHNPRFSVSSSDICSMFGNVFPLLEAMNR
ncbi:MAG TPA: hypothetical protein VF614_16430 [Chthoniobacteraceae bacterium]|jgi:hypothetical protein